jgi:glucose-6-phosphate dehydrogenase assembly protein OpcA
VADAVATLASWSEERVRVGDVLAALDGLRHGVHGLGATRASVLTLVIVGRDRAAIDQAEAAIHELGGHHPARVLTLLVSEGAVGLDAEVRLLGGSAEGQALWFEEIALGVGGGAADHLDSLIEPFTISDLPVVVWFVDDVPLPTDPLLSAADVLMVDARALGDVDCFPRLTQLVRRLPVVDLSWVRLRPWRELLGGLFEGAAFRPFLDRVEHVEVRGKTGPRHLLGGWLADRLRLPSDGVHLSAAEHVSIRVVAGTAVFEVARRGDERVVHASATIEGGPSTAALVRLPLATPAWGLPDALTRLEHDPVYEHALRRALP